MPALDVGSNYGVTAFTLAHAGFSPVLAFEPVPENFRRFKANHELESNLHLSGKIVPIQAAAGARAEDQEFVVYPGSPGQCKNSGAADIKEIDQKIRVRGTTINDECRVRGISAVGFIKIDV